jgi:hypothetical protein
MKLLNVTIQILALTSFAVAEDQPKAVDLGRAPAATSKKEVGVITPMEYQSGSLPLSQYATLNTFVNKDEVVLVQGKQRFVIPVKDITEVSYANDVWEPTTQKRYVGIVWSAKPGAAAKGGTGTPNKGGIIFKGIRLPRQISVSGNPVWDWRHLTL